MQNVNKQQWLDIYADLDAYIAKGGRLTELPHPYWDKVPLETKELLAKRMSPERFGRLERFMQQVAGFRDVYTEAQLQGIWHDAAQEPKNS